MKFLEPLGVRAQVLEQGSVVNCAGAGDLEVEVAVGWEPPKTPDFPSWF